MSQIYQFPFFNLSIIISFLIIKLWRNTYFSMINSRLILIYTVLILMSEILSESFPLIDEFLFLRAIIILLLLFRANNAMFTGDSFTFDNGSLQIIDQLFLVSRRVLMTTQTLLQILAGVPSLSNLRTCFSLRQP